MRSATRYLHWRDLLIELVSRDLKLRYQRSLIGLGWSLVKPLTQLVVFSIVFSSILPLNIPFYTTFVFAGVLVWNWFSTAVASATGSIVSSRELVRRPGFPVLLLPMLSVLGQAVHFVLALPLLLLGATIDAGFPGFPLLALPLLVVLQFILTLGPSYLLAAAQVYFRDTEQFVGLTLMLGFYITPVFYRPIQHGEEFGFLTKWNPIAWLLQCYRDVFVNGAWPQPWAVFQILLVALPLLVIGIVVFSRVSARFDEEI